MSLKAEGETWYLTNSVKNLFFKSAMFQACFNLLFSSSFLSNSILVILYLQTLTFISFHVLLIILVFFNILEFANIYILYSASNGF